MFFGQPVAKSLKEQIELNDPYYHQNLGYTAIPIPQTYTTPIINKIQKILPIYNIDSVDTFCKKYGLSFLYSMNNLFDINKALEGIILMFKVDKEELINPVAIPVLLANYNNQYTDYKVYKGIVILLESLAFFIPDYNYNKIELQNIYNNKWKKYIPSTIFQVSRNKYTLFNNDIWTPYFDNSGIVSGTEFEKIILSNIKRKLLKENI